MIVTTIPLTYLVCIMSFVRTDTIIKDNPAQFNAMATDANGKSIPVSGEVDTIQVFDIHQLGQDTNDTGLKIDIGVSPLNASNGTANSTTTVAAPSTTTTPQPPAKLSDFWFPENVTTSSKVPALVPAHHPFTSPLNLSIPSAPGHVSDNSTSSDTSNSTNSTPVYPPSSGFDQTDNSRPAPFRFNPWWTDQQQSSSNNVSSFDAPKSNQFNMFGGGRPFFGPWNAQQNRAGGPRADIEPYPVNFDNHLNDTHLAAANNEKNQTSDSLFGFLTKLLPKTSKDRDSNMKGIDYNIDYKNSSSTPSYADRLSVNSSDKSDRIDPGMYASNYWSPSQWDSFANITFDEDRNATSEKGYNYKSTNANFEDNNDVNLNKTSLSEKPSLEFASFNAFKIGNGTPTWMINFSNLNAARFFQQSPSASFLSSGQFDDSLNYTTKPLGPMLPLLPPKPALPFVTNLPTWKPMNLQMPPLKKATVPTKTRQLADDSSSDTSFVDTKTDSSSFKGDDYMDAASKQILDNVPFASRLRNFGMKGDEQNEDIDDNDTNDVVNTEADPVLKGNEPNDSNNGRSFISLPSSVLSLLTIVGVLTGFS